MGPTANSCLLAIFIWGIEKGWANLWRAKRTPFDLHERSQVT